MEVRATATPVPAAETDCGLPAALSATTSVPVRSPTAVGVNVTEIAQVPLLGTVLGESGQVLVWAKSPVIVIPVIVSGVL